MAHRWILYKTRPPFDGRYRVRTPGSACVDECQVIGGVVLDADGDQVVNFSCEWQRIS